MFSCQGGLNWIYHECTVKNVLLSRWFDLVRHGYGTKTRTRWSRIFEKRFSWICLGKKLRENGSRVTVTRVVHDRKSHRETLVVLVKNKNEI